MSKHKSGYVKLKHLVELAKKYPNAVLAYPVDPNKYEYSSRLVAEITDEVVEMHPDNVGPGRPKYRHVVILK